MKDTITTTTAADPAALRQRWEALRAESPHLRIRDCAEQLGVSEATLLATTVGDSAVRLQGDWPAFVKRLPELGRVMSLTRNPSCVLEHKGTFQKIATFGEGDHAMGYVIGPIETRLFFRGWHVGFAVKQETKAGVRESLQIFDREGTAVTKIYLLDESDRDACNQLVNDYLAEDQSTHQPLGHYEPEEYADAVDQEALLRDWAALTDTHQFFGMLRAHKVHRLDAVRYAEGQFTERLRPGCVRQLLEEAARTELPIMIFAGNRGNLQIHQGPVRTIRLMEGKPPAVWVNVLDPDFNLHLREDHIDSAWVVEKPTSDGTVTGIELFDAQGNFIAQFFGLRKPGVPEKSGWRELIATLPRA